MARGAVLQVNAAPVIISTNRRQLRDLSLLSFTTDDDLAAVTQSPATSVPCENATSTGSVSIQSSILP